MHVPAVPSPTPPWLALADSSERQTPTPTDFHCTSLRPWTKNDATRCLLLSSIDSGMHLHRRSDMDVETDISKTRRSCDYHAWLGRPPHSRKMSLYHYRLVRRDILCTPAHAFLSSTIRS